MPGRRPGGRRCRGGAGRPGSARPLPEVLDTTALTVIPDAGTSFGAHLLTDPALHLADPAQPWTQVRQWREQVALDAGPTGAERLLQQTPSQPG
jgi:hypothetical protein